MKQLHEKSPCCQEKVRRFGKRRRQCTLCLKTWRVWKKKRGRDARRIPPLAIPAYLENRSPRTRMKLPTRRSRLRKALVKFNASTPWPSVPNTQEPLILIADALMQFFRGKPWTVYMLLVRPVKSRQAYILPPVLRQGREHAPEGWAKALDTIPENVRSRIISLVCDGAVSLVFSGKKRGWEIQRCHFHLRWRIANYVRTGALSRNPRDANAVKALVDAFLSHPNEQVAKRNLARLDILRSSLASQGLRRVLSGFLKCHTDFRTYLRHPEWHLPATTNSIEHLIGNVRDVQRRARGFPNPSSFFQWLVAVCKHRQTVTCNGKNQPN